MDKGGVTLGYKPAYLERDRNRITSKSESNHTLLV